MRLVISFCVIILSSLLLANFLYADIDTNKKGLNQLRNRIENLQKHLANKEESRLGLSNILQESKQAIKKITKKLDSLNVERHKIKNRINQLQKKSDLTQNKILNQQTHLSKLLYQQYIGGNNEHLKLIINQKDPNQIAREIYYFGYISRARIEDIDKYHADLINLRAIVDEANKETTKIIEIQEEYEEQKGILQQEEIKHKNLLASISKEVKKGKNKVLKLQEDEKQLSALVARIAKIKEQNKEKTSKNLSPNKNYFKNKKGNLYFPVDGKIINSFGSPKSKGRSAWRGLFISAPIGIDVIAIADGKVVFANWLRGFGNVLIVDHGGGYMSLYGNNKILTKKVDEAVQGGDIIASVGNNDRNLRSGLYFELSYKGKPFDPSNWIRLK
ncbi:MAG: peptidase M23 [Nitrosomonadaceae bacterium]|nr:peptidase M23 [Nitrosomonadaceae bacterium]|tara:strand:- start:175 stop:1338 length:1164 start_codon:yes stop_codon:yes gene_type:complete